MSVIDASALVELLLATPSGLRVADRIADERQAIHAPELVDVEVPELLRRLEREGRVDAARAAAAVGDLADLDLRRHAHLPLAPRVWALRGRLNAYDAVCVALAEVLDVPLLTRDRRLAAAAGDGVRVEWIGDGDPPTAG